jgi:hypothetical protein
MKIHPFLLVGSTSGTHWHQPRVHRAIVWRSNSQTMTTFGTTGANNCTTATGSHTNEEAVGTLATNNGRLIGAFHY